MKLWNRIKYHFEKTVFIRRGSRIEVGPYVNRISRDNGVVIPALACSDMCDWKVTMYDPQHEIESSLYGDAIGRGSFNFSYKGVAVFASYTKQSVKLFQYIDQYEVGWGDLYVEYSDADIIHDFFVEQREVTGKDTIVFCMPAFINVCGELGSCVTRVGSYGAWEVYSLPEFLKYLSKEHDINIFQYKTIKIVHGNEMYSNGKAVKCMNPTYIITLKLNHSVEANRYYSKTMCLLRG